MTKRTISIVAATATLLALLLSGCSNAGSGGGGGGETAVSVDPVEDASLSETASLADFSNSSAYDNAPTDGTDTDKERALLVTGQAVGTVSEFLGAFFMANPDWSPSGTFEMSPDPDSSGFESATSYSLSAGFSNEEVYLDENSEDPDGDSVDYIGEALIEASAYLGATRQASSYGIDYPSRVTLEAELAADLDHADTSYDDDSVADPIQPSSSNSDAMPTVEAGAVHAAVNWNLDARPSYSSTDDGPEPKAVEAAYAISARVSAALSVAHAQVADTDGDGDIDADDELDGHYLVDLSFADNELLNVSDSMTEQEIQDYLTDKLAGDFSLSITVSDDNDNSYTYDYTISDIVDILSSM